MAFQFHLVDVFGGERFRGNPVAVVFATDALDEEAMQDITRWLNLSETTFILPPTDPGADYRLRIFTLDRELAFAGHPTLGSCHAWLANGGVPQGPDIIQQSANGLVPVRQTQNGLAFAAPPLFKDGPPTAVELDHAVDLLGIEHSDIVDAQWVDNGPGWLGILLRSAEEVLSLKPPVTRGVHADIGVIGPYPAESAIGWEVRAFFNDHNGNLLEDPVTGSLNAAMGQWLFATGRAHRHYVAAQGTALGRVGRLFVEQETGGTVWVAGRTESLFLGTSTF